MIAVDYVMSCSCRYEMGGDHGILLIPDHQLAFIFRKIHLALFIAVGSERKRLAVSPVFDNIGLEHLVTRCFRDIDKKRRL